MPIDPLDDYALYNADFVFPSWNDEVALRLKALFSTLEAEEPRQPIIVGAIVRTEEYLGTIDEILDIVKRWVEEIIPAGLTNVLEDPVLQTLFPEPDLTFLVHKTVNVCFITPHLLNYPYSRRDDDERLFIDFRELSCTVEHDKGITDQFILTLPGDYTWRFIEMDTVERYTGQPDHRTRRWGTSEDEWLDILETGDEHEKSNAVLHLEKSNHPRVVDALIRVLLDKQADDFSRRMAARGLGMMGDPRAIDQLYHTAQYAMEENHSPAVAAFHAMSHFLDPRITELLVDTALHAGHRSGRWYAAVCGLGRINDPQGFDYLVALLRKDETVLSDEVAYERSHPRTDCTSQIRRAAATALGEMADPKSITPLHEALATGDPVAKACAAYALSLKGDYSGINLLLEEWEQTEKFQVSGGFLFLQFVKLFGKLGEARSIPILIDALEHKDANEFGEIRRQAKESLKSITGQNFGLSRKRWRQWWNEQHST